MSLFCLLECKSLVCNQEVAGSNPVGSIDKPFAIRKLCEIGQKSVLSQKGRGYAGATMKNIIDSTKEVVNLISDLKNMELLQKMLVHQNQVIDLDAENRSLKTRVLDLEEALSLREKLIPRNNCYWLPKDDGTQDGPFCLRCYEQDQKARRMFNDNCRAYACTVCGFILGDDGDDVDPHMQARLERLVGRTPLKR